MTNDLDSAKVAYDNNDTTMTDAELEKLLDDLESDRVERKETTADTDKLRQAICAFANELSNHGQPGVLFIGVRDNGQPCGLEVTDQLLLTLAPMRSDGNILPLPAITVQKRRLKGADIAVIEVLPADAPPVRFKGAAWVRVGPRRAIASPPGRTHAHRAAALPRCPL